MDILNDDIFDQTPLQKYREIIIHSNSKSVEGELERVLKRIVKLESIIENEFKGDVEVLLSEFDIYKEGFEFDFEDVVLESMSNILSQE